ncbi:MAG: TonB family protein [Nitrospirota bacterium]|nr:TonB family protein [Nitrospirota bacterium]
MAEIVTPPALSRKTEVLRGKDRSLPVKRLEQPAPKITPSAEKPSVRQEQSSSPSETSGSPVELNKGLLPEKGIRPPGQGSGVEGESGMQRLPRGRELFDSRIIGDIARLKPAEKGKEESEVTFSTKELKYYSYMMKLKGKIERIWRYPPEAVRRGLYGDPYIRFTIKKDGYLGSVELVRTSGYRELDEAAMQALRDGEPYWPLPENWDMDGITITGHFVYTLYGTYLR